MELLDYRPAKSTQPDLEQPERSRVVLSPNDESRWADICLLNQKADNSWTDADSLQVEARLLVRRGNAVKLLACLLIHDFQLATAPPLCLEPDVHLTRVVNATQRVSTPPAPLSLKRKASAVDQEADDIENARRLKIMQFMVPRRDVTRGSVCVPPRSHAGRLHQII